MKYSFAANTWIKQPTVNNLPADFCTYYEALGLAINSEQQLFIYNSKGTLATIQLKNMDTLPANWNVIQHNSLHTNIGTKAIIINNQLHIIGGNWFASCKHLKYNSDTQSFDSSHSIQFGYPALVKLNNKLLSFGGHRSIRGPYDPYLNDVQEYDIINETWIKCKSVISREMIVDGAVTVLNQQFIILFGGYNGENINEIWIYSVKEKTFKESKVRCPGKRGGRAFAINDPTKDELSVFGYIRSQWRKCGICDHSFMPRYLIKIVNRYYMNERIHLIDIFGGEHWAIDVFDIFDEY